MQPDALVIAIFLSVVANRLIQALIVPLFDKFALEKFYLLYISWIVAALLVWFANVNLFTGYLPDALSGRLLSAVVCGGGANFISDLFGSTAKSQVAPRVLG